MNIKYKTKTKPNKNPTAIRMKNPIKINDINCRKIKCHSRGHKAHSIILTFIIQKIQTQKLPLSGPQISQTTLDRLVLNSDYRRSLHLNI